MFSIELAESMAAIILEPSMAEIGFMNIGKGILGTGIVKFDQTRPNFGFYSLDCMIEVPTECQDCDGFVCAT